MKTKVKLVLLFLIISIQIPAQSELYLPRNLKQAYDNGTRSFNGKPGSLYWQNRANYIIDVNIDLKNHLLSGGETIEYFNNSPDTLKTLVIRNYQNIFKKGAARDFAFQNPDGLTDGIRITKIIIDNIEYDFPGEYVSDAGTIMTIKLKNYIIPSGKSNIQFKWNFQLQDKQTLRMGFYDSTSCFMAYWYPQISVYDDIDGWDVLPYTGLTEFYNDFNNYQVHITIPDNFIVWATGTLVNPENVMDKKLLERYYKAQQSDSVINLITEEDLTSANFLTNAGSNTWKFEAENVTDFAFAFSDHYLWDAVSLMPDSTRNQRVFISAAYRKESDDFKIVAKIAREIIDYLSTEMPAVPFPFPALTVFNGGKGGGMEFPMMVNDGSTKTIQSTVGLTSHEISHQYFPFYMGINEKKYAFMDEGWAVFLPLEYQLRYYKNEFPRISEIRNYEKFAGMETELPVIIPSFEMNYRSYRTASYVRPSLAYRFLQNAMGDSLFLAALQEFIHNWNGKHPVPYDFFFTFDRIAGENLDWFWKPWFFNPGYPDLKLSKAVVDGDSIRIFVEMKGTLPTPVSLKLIYDDETIELIDRNVDVWKNSEQLEISHKILKPVKEIILGREDIPDTDRSNNLIVIH